MDTAPLDALEALFGGAGAERGAGGDPTRAGHLLRAAALAEADGARPALVAAALLHGIDALDRGERADDRRDRTGADRLAAWFGPDVTEPVRLHAAAGRYLCRAEPGYADRLPAPALRALALQGGPMTVAEARAYESEPYARDAVTLRRWDERARDPAARVPPFAHYRPLLAALLTASGPASCRPRP
ncbi:hypothetical protein RVR_2813 [Actinacidiphila reveromycinica]|uniref:HD domain-containing protein n=1 Tax=Actinacidiphila reveromycinica TaxID=659352 RepID=A0A7U3UMV9_9ACTN|nr:metal-dependent phosphohydrolase [Streptomyces sp. SN-593]BBA97185.1 hypothetical protein RVR_2813 [Streptomyces sp. SN-593]